MKQRFKKMMAVWMAFFMMFIMPFGNADILAEEYMEDSIGTQNSEESVLTAETQVNVLSSSGAATSGTCGANGDNLTWTFDSSTGTLTISGTGDMASYSYGSAPWNSYCSLIKAVEIAEGVTSIGSYAFSYCRNLISIEIPEGVTSIGDNAFWSCSNLTSIVISEGVTSIGNGAFSGCSSLTSIVIPEGVTSVGHDAFQGCSSLTSIEIPSSVTSIGNGVFNSCSSLTSIEIPSSVTSIGNGAFSGCSSLTSIEIPSSVTSIGYGAFSYCSSLESITVAEGNRVYHSEGNCLIETVRKTLIAGCKNSVIPTDGSVTSIRDDAFQGCSSLTSIEIPLSVRISSYAFNGCSSLTSIIVDDNNLSYRSIDGVLFNKDQTILVCYPAGKTETAYTIPDGVTSIGEYAFNDCISLTSIEIPSSVTSIWNYAYNGCSRLASVIFGENSKLTSIGYRAFEGCNSLTSIEIPSSVTSIGGNAFTNCMSLYIIYNNSNFALQIGSSSYGDIAQFAKLIINKNGNKTYRNDGAEYIDTEEGLLFKKQNGGYQLIAYFGAEETVTLPKDINGNRYEIYQMRGVRNVIISDGVTSIGNNAFDGCRSLKNIEIPSSVTSIGNQAFSNCSSLESITVAEGNNVYHSEGNCLIETASKTLIVGCKSSVIPTDGSVTSIGDNAFYYCHSLTSIEIPSSVTSIGYMAFSSCSSLTSIVIQEGVTSIGDYAFWGCERLTSIEIPSSVTSIGNGAFEDCSQLKYNEYDNGLYLGNAQNPYLALIKTKRTDITSCVVHEQAQVIAYEAFQFCSNLTSVTFGENSKLTSIGYMAFSNCSSLTNIKIPSSVTSIWDNAFYYCSSLTSIEIPSNVVRIGDAAFFQCKSLTSIIIYNKDCVIDGASFQTIPTTATIYGYAGSTAQAYAEKYGNEFVALPEEPALSLSQIILETNQARAGETVTLTISLQDAPSVKSMMLYDFIYDSAYVEIVEAKWLVDGIIATWDPETGEALMANEANIDLNGGILELVIRVKEGTPDGIQEISFSAILKQKAESGEEVTLDVEVVSGGVEVVSYITGDINGDETINSDDAIYLLKHTFLPEQYPLSGSGDMNGDGRVDSDDAVYLLKHTFLPEQYPLP